MSLPPDATAVSAPDLMPDGLIDGATGSDAVRCAGLTYRFGEHVAVDHVDLRYRPG